MSLHPFHDEATAAQTIVRAERIFAFEESDDLPIFARQFSPRDAFELQTRLLPTRPPQISGFVIDAISFPAALVGGDHFNFCSVGGDRLGLLIFDVSGKGASAALIAARLRAIFRTQCWSNRDPRDVLIRAHEFVTHLLPPANFVTAIYGVLEPSKNRFTFARAGHEPLAHIRPVADRENQISWSSPMGLPLGIGTREEFADLLEVESIELAPQERIVMFTDGLTEARDGLSNEFGLERIENTLRNSKSDDIAQLTNAMTQFCQDAPAHDDVTLLSLCRQ